MGQQSAVVQYKSARLYFADSIGTNLDLTQAAKDACKARFSFIIA